MVINSLFIINTNESKIFMEKHWCAAIKRGIMDDFLNKLKSVSNPNDMPITMVGPNEHYYIHIYFENLIFCAVLREETCPLMVTEFFASYQGLIYRLFWSLQCRFDQGKFRNRL